MAHQGKSGELAKVLNSVFPFPLQERFVTKRFKSQHSNYNCDQSVHLTLQNMKIRENTACFFQTADVVRK